MKISEVFSEEGIFYGLKQASPERFADVFDSDSTEMLDELFKSRYASRTVSPYVQVIADSKGGQLDTNSITLIGGICWVNFYNSWKRLKAAAESTTKYDVDYQVSSVKTTTLEGKRVDENSSQLESSAYGFDSETPKPASKETTTDSNDRSTSSTETVTNELTGAQGSYSQHSLIKGEFELSSLKFIDVVLKDLADFATIQIYE